ncbi:MAG: DUF3696 domain-containing protein [Gammaproteobacteria bacterium]|nr:DUF3696 domain-containing protein [Gammaproteobacteria bacterium]
MLTRIKLSNLKCFERLLLPVAPLTLFTGPNASGKSSVLQALVLIHQTMREHEWSTRLALNGAGVRLGAMLDVVDEISGRDSFGILLADDKDSFEWTFGGDRRDMSMEVQRVSVNGKTAEAPTRLRYLLPPDGGADLPLARQIHGLSYITAERAPPQDTYTLEDPHNVATVGPKGEHAVSVLHWGRDEPVIESLILPDAPPNRFKQVEEHMRKFFPGYRMEVQQPQRSNAVTLGIRMSDDTEFHRPAHTGFGLTQSLPIVVAALSASEGDIILIENPEVHLHPAGQALMGRFLADVAHAGVQVFVETHSDHVLNGIRRSVKDGKLSAGQVAIHFFQARSAGQPQVASPMLDDSGNIDSWPEGFFDQFDIDANYFAGWGED